jgi:spore coat protein A, manganese oxidase
MLTRRRFLKLGAVAGAFMVLPRRVRPESGSSPTIARAAEELVDPEDLTKYSESLPIPPVINAEGRRTFNLTIEPSIHQFHSSLPATPTWGYAGATYLGPTFEVQRGNPISINWTNNLGAHLLADVIDPTLHGPDEANDAEYPRLSVHLHGGHTEPESDGYPEDTFLPGETHPYYYINDQEAATLWYHDHALGITRLNVYAGLAGFYLVRDPIERSAGLPQGPFDIPLVIQDRMFNADGSLHYPVNEVESELIPPIWIPEFFGDIAVVNGKVWPNLTVKRGLYRFRLLNGSNARVYNLTLSNGQPMYQVATDGGLLDAPVEIDSLLLAPGERADVLIDFSTLSASTKIQLLNDAPIPFPDGDPNDLPEIMQFTVGQAGGLRRPIPTRLRRTPIPTLTPTSPEHVRNVTLVEVMDEEVDEPIIALLNNLHWDTEEIEEPKVNTVEQWNIINTTGDAHPIHLHLVQFLIKDRQAFDVEAYLDDVYGGEIMPEHAGHGPWPAPSADDYVTDEPDPPAPNERGWKDTVVALPGEITRILVPFGGTEAGLSAPFSTSITGEYVWHCHILEHEDHEMMLPYHVVE